MEIQGSGKCFQMLSSYLQLTRFRNLGIQLLLCGKTGSRHHGTCKVDIECWLAGGSSLRLRRNEKHRAIGSGTIDDHYACRFDINETREANPHIINSWAILYDF